MKVAVTGGAGFIGRHTVKALLDDVAHEVVVIDDLSTGSPRNLDGLERVRLSEGSILDIELLDRAFSGCSAIVHLAARPSVPRSIDDPLASHESNATGTLQVLEAARRAGGVHVIVASSSSVYGGNPALPKSEGLLPQPMSPYAVSKLATESYALAHAACYDLPVLAFRFFNVFGPHQSAGHAYAAVIPNFVAAALTDTPLTVHGDGKQSRDFTYVGTVAEVLTDAVRRQVVAPTPVNLAFGSRRTLLDVITELEAILGRELPVRHTEPRSGDVPHSQADDTLLRSLFPDVTPLEFPEALRCTVAWMQESSR